MVGNFWEPLFQQILGGMCLCFHQGHLHSWGDLRTEDLLDPAGSGLVGSPKPERRFSGPEAGPGASCPVHRREAAGGQVLPGCSSQGRRICSKPWQPSASQLMWALQRPSPSSCAPKTALLRAPINLLRILGALCKNFWKLAWHLQITQESLQGSLQPSSGTADVPGMRMGNVDGDPGRGSSSRIANPLHVLRPGGGRGGSASAGGSTGCPALRLCLILPPRLAAVNKAARTLSRDLCGPGSRV